MRTVVLLLSLVAAAALQVHQQAGTVPGVPKPSACLMPNYNVFVEEADLDPAGWTTFDYAGAMGASDGGANGCACFFMGLTATEANVPDIGQATPGFGAKMYGVRDDCHIYEQIEAFERLAKHFGRCTRDGFAADGDSIDGTPGEGVRVTDLVECYIRQGVVDAKAVMNPAGVGNPYKLMGWARVGREMLAALESNIVATGGLGGCDHVDISFETVCNAPGQIPGECCYWPYGATALTHYTDPISAAITRIASFAECYNTARADTTMCDPLKSVFAFIGDDSNGKSADDSPVATGFACGELTMGWADSTTAPDGCNVICLCNAMAMPCADPLHSESTNDPSGSTAGHWTGGFGWRRATEKTTCMVQSL